MELVPRDRLQLSFACWATPTALILPDALSDDEWQRIGEQLHYVQGSILWWLGDWAAFGERKYGDLKKAADVTGYDPDTIRHAKWVSDTFEVWRRRHTLSWSHHREVAALPEAEQDAWLGRAEEGRWDRTRLRLEIRSHRKALMSLALPPGLFDVIYADPPWPYPTQIESWGPTSLHYETLELEELTAMDVASRAADNAALFLWATNPHLDHALDLAEAWGFTYKTNIVWVKTGLQRPGSGYYLRGRHELLFICTRGSHVPDQLGREPIGSVLYAGVQEHSRKPTEVYDLIERIYPGTKYLELFLRGEARPGWVGWGQEADAPRD